MFYFNAKKRVFLGLVLAGLVLLAAGFAIRGHIVAETAGMEFTAVTKQDHLGKPGINGPVAVISPESQTVNRTPASVTGTGSYHTLKSRTIVSYEFTYSAPVSMVYQGTDSVAFFISESPTYVTLTVTDDKGNTDSATAVIYNVVYPTP